MKRLFAVCVLSLLYTTAFSQIRYESGYFIDNEGNRTEALIRNIDWRYNPSQFSYKLSPDQDPKTADIANVMEFGIYNFSRYVRRTVNIDRSSDDTNSLTSSREPEWSEEMLFLKVIVEGQATLLHFEDGSLTRYFYILNDEPAEQLIYKRYKTGPSNIATNAQYRQQLFMDLRCDNHLGGKPAIT